MEQDNEKKSKKSLPYSKNTYHKKVKEHGKKGTRVTCLDIKQTQIDKRHI